MNQGRRTFLKNAGTLSAIAAALTAGLLKSGEAIAAVWNKSAFTAKALDVALKESGYAGAIGSADVLIKTPEIAENGSVVPVEASSSIPGTTSIAIFVDLNPNPFIADFAFSNGAVPFVSTRIKMAKTSTVRVLVKAGGKVYTAHNEVKVTAGGCGG